MSLIKELVENKMEPKGEWILDLCICVVGISGALASCSGVTSTSGTIKYLN